MKVWTVAEAVAIMDKWHKTVEAKQCGCNNQNPLICAENALHSPGLIDKEQCNCECHKYE